MMCMIELLMSRLFVSSLTHKAEKKWPLVRRRQLQMQFLQWKYLYFDYYFTEVCSWGSNQQHSSIGSDKGLAPIRRKPLSESMIVSLLTHICVTRPQWVKDSQFYQSNSMGPLNHRSQETTIIWWWCWEPEKHRGRFEMYLTQIWLTPFVVYWHHIA